MKINKFSTTSKKRLATCHKNLQYIMMAAIKKSSVDFGIAEGHRSVERQNKLFIEGKSKIDGINRLGQHNHQPSMAADIYLFINGKASWSNEALSFVAGIIHATAEDLYEAQLIHHKIRWGGNWDKDGEILTDQSFDDRPHFELYKP